MPSRCVGLQLQLTVVFAGVSECGQPIYLKGTRRRIAGMKLWKWFLCPCVNPEKWTKCGHSTLGQNSMAWKTVFALFQKREKSFCFYFPITDTIRTCQKLFTLTCTQCSIFDSHNVSDHILLGLLLCISPIAFPKFACCSMSDLYLL